VFFARMGRGRILDRAKCGAGSDWIGADVFLVEEGAGADGRGVKLAEVIGH
jgi:hypothetical protein